MHSRRRTLACCGVSRAWMRCAPPQPALKNAPNHGAHGAPMPHNIYGLLMLQGAIMPEPLHLFLDRLDTPIGDMLIVTDNEGNLRAIDWAEYEARMCGLLRRQYGANGFHLEEKRAPQDIRRALERYFAGDVTAIDALPVKTAGTPFQRKVWSALQEIPCGTTVSYAALAEQIGKPSAVRAV